MPRGKPKDYFTPDEVVEMLRGVATERGISEKDLEEMMKGTSSIFAEKKSKGLLVKFLELQNEGKDFDEICKDLGYKPYELRRALRPNKIAMGKLLNQGVGEMYLLFLKTISRAHEIMDMKLGRNDYKALTAQVTLSINIWKAMGMFEKGGMPMEDTAQDVASMKRDISRIMQDPDVARILGIEPTESVN